MTTLDYVQQAMALAERERWPRVGLSTTRRALRALAGRYNDKNIQCLVCFICGQQRTTCAGYPVVDLEADAGCGGGRHTEIMYHTLAEVCGVEEKHPGTLLNNCGLDLWRRRYRDRDRGEGRRGMAGAARTTNPWTNTEPLTGPLRLCEEKDRNRHISQWAVELTFSGRSCTMFGCSEDVRCSDAERHVQDFDEQPFCRKLCGGCEVPVCQDCWRKLHLHDSQSSFADGSTIPMSLSLIHI